MEQMIMGEVMKYTFHPAAMGMYAPALLLLIYFFVQWDARREGSPNAGDTQIGIKVAVHLFAILGILIAAGGANSILGFILGKIKGGAPSEMIKAGIGNLIAGGGVFVACYLMLLPRTNWKEHDKVSRLSYGIVAALSGVFAITAVSGFISGLIAGAPWGVNAPLLSATIVYGGLGFLTLTKLGGASGWVAPPPRAGGFGGGGGYDPNQGYQQQGYPPQGQPPQGGYPPQGGSPPAGGGYPPQGGGGYPPQGGGGLPPPGGGYPPQGGGGGGGGY
jgi:hypothetical protein